MDLLAQACRDAKERATQLASGFGCKLGPIHAITQRDFFNIAGAFGVGIEGSGRGISTGSGMLEGIAEEHRILYVPSTIDCENSVLAIFRIKP